MTGESLPVEAGAGSTVLAGYINGQGVLEVEFFYAEGLDNRSHGRDAGIASARAQIARLAVPA